MGLFSGGGLANVSNVYYTRRDKMEAIDRKFKIAATSINNGHKHSQQDAILFLASDALLPALLDKYKELCIENMADDRQIKAVELLKERVVTWQTINKKKVHVPDVDEGKEEKRVCKENRD
jgi:UV DNA damage repair endonuclease